MMYQDIACRLVEFVGYMAELVCTGRCNGVVERVPVTTAQYAGLDPRVAEDHVCPACGAPTQILNWVAAYWDGDRVQPARHLPPGAMYWAPWAHLRLGHCLYWDNCAGAHLHVVLPNGLHWDIDGRASNCTRPQDRWHRCWVREGDPPRVTVGTNGDTCGAGAGSILARDYHGFLRDGVLTAI